MGNIKKIGTIPSRVCKFPVSGTLAMNKRLPLFAFGIFLVFAACQQEDRKGDAANIRESIRRQDSIAAENRLDALRRDLELSRRDTLPDSSLVRETN